MKIVVENKIPYIKEAIQLVSNNVVYLSSNDFTTENIRDADVLIVRTRVKCNEQLLKGTKVKFIATATIGFDHIDVDYCKRAGILWQNAPGCNSGSVQQYIESSLYLLERQFNLLLSNMTIAIIGVGHVGRKIEALCREIGMRVLLHDPYRRDAEVNFNHSSLDEIFAESDIITFHVPLSRGGKYPTYHLVDSSFFSKFTKGIFVMNTSRGEVIETNSLKEALNLGVVKQAIIDVWENEPHIDLELLNKVFIGTPHIAGYSADGKSMASQMALQAVCDFYKIDRKISIAAPRPMENQDMVLEVNSYSEAALAVYNPEKDSKLLKDSPDKFEWFRGHYYVRRELLSYTIHILS